MFKNLQLFEELIFDREIVSALKAVVMKEKSLVLLYSETPLWREKKYVLRVVPVESDTTWETRMSDMLEPLKVSTEGYSTCDGRLQIESFYEWLYESEGFGNLLKSHVSKPGLFWVCNESELAVKALEEISRFGEKLKETTLSDIRIPGVKYLIDDKGTKQEALGLEIFYNKARKQLAAHLTSWYVHLNSLGVVDPISHDLRPAFNLRDSQQKRKPATEVDYILNKFLDATNGKGGKPHLSRYMTEEVGAEFVPPDRFEWEDPTGTKHKKSEKRLLNQLSELRKQHKK